MQHHPVEFVGHPGHPPPPIGAPVPPMLGAAGASALPPSIPTPLVVASLGKRHRFHRISFDLYVKIGCKIFIFNHLCLVLLCDQNSFGRSKIVLV